MKKIFKTNTVLSLILFIGLSSCGKPEDGVVDKLPTSTPGMAQGTLPENGEPCADVEAISGESLKVSVSFRWTSAKFAENYDLRIFESQDEVYKETVTSLEAIVELDRGKSYAWSITAKNSDGETVSNTNSFTTPGEPIGNYVPYAAVITVEFITTTSEMDVSWIGSDEDGDTLIYDVLVKEDEDLLVELTDVTVDSLNSIPFIPTSSYNIEVICKDNFGNFSISKHSETAPN